ncbi:P-loop containing nucleoside triphosphate hydrolase protein [Mycena leptocephala]|nr:P-loop containing nucleoside triphosphate hydrolase protein [Mycena leptocephala]
MKQLKRVQVLYFLVMIAIVGGIIAHAILYSDLDKEAATHPTQVNQTINNCPPPSRIFHGRQNILDKMHKYFSQNQMQQHILLLYGVGGAGKTQIALKFIQTSSCFSDTFYIDARTQDTINAGLKNIALIKAGNTSQDALNWLQGKHNQWLLFFDNADDPEVDLNPFLPQCDHGNIIIASRNPALRFYAGSDAHVSDMEETDAIKLLLTRAAQEVTPRNEGWLPRLSRFELSCLPLAIIQAGAFIAESGALHTYLKLYKQNRERLLSKKPAQSHDDYGRTVHTTWQISFDRLSELAQTFLQLCSFLHNQGISEKIFSKASVYKFPASGPSKEELQKPMEFLSQYLGPMGDWDSLRFTEVTNQLQAYSLIEFNTVTGLFSVHPLVHSWSQSTLTDPEIYHYSMVAIVGMAITTIPETDVQLVLQLVPHIDSLRKGQTYVTPDFNMQYGSIYYYAERYKEAAEHEYIFLEKLRGYRGEDHPSTLTIMGNLAITYTQMGQSTKAEELEVAVFKTQRDVLGGGHPDTLHTMGNLAWTYHRLGHMKKAQELEVVEKQRDIIGEDHPDTLLAMADLALTYCRLGQFKRAEELEVVVLKKRQDILGEDHPDTLLAMGDLALTYQELGQLDKAQELEVAVLRKQRDTLGEDHPDTLLAMANLALTYSRLGQFKPAEKLEVVVLQKRQDALGEDHPDTLLAMGNLAWTYQRLGQLNKAEELEVVVLKKRQDVLGEDHPDTLLAMGNLAWTYQKLGQLTKAEDLEVVLLKKQQDILGESHLDTLRAMGNLAWTYHRLGHIKKAQELELAVLAKQRDILGKDRV